MPTYDYKCDSCGFDFEKFMGINDSSQVLCPDCGKSAKRQLSIGAGFIVKGKSAATGHSCQAGSPCCGRESRCDGNKCDM
jgi:putative FmdB family regulatory protein